MIGLKVGNMESNVITPKLRLRVAYYRLQNKIHQSETSKSHHGNGEWLNETEETTTRLNPLSRMKRSAQQDWLERRKGKKITPGKVEAEVLNDYFFVYKTDKVATHEPIKIKAEFTESHYVDDDALVKMIDNTLNSAIRNALNERFAHTRYLAEGLKYVHAYIDTKKFYIMRTEAMEQLKLSIDLKLHPTMQHLLGHDSIHNSELWRDLPK